MSYEIKNKTEFNIKNVSDVLWTLTDRCNLNCIYCSVIPQNGQPSSEPTLEEAHVVLKELKTLPKLESIILSGGEALIYPYFENVIKSAYEMDIANTVYLITNGTTLRRKQKDLLAYYSPRVMVSLDSVKEHENAITRGNGVLEKSLQAINWLIKKNIFTVVIIVYSRHSNGNIKNTILELYNIGVRNILIQQLHCSSPGIKELFLDIAPSTESIRELFIFLEEFKSRHPDANFDDNEICFFEKREGERYKKCMPNTEYLPQRLFMCGAGHNFFAIKADGNVIPCNAFLGCTIGNIYKENIVSILSHSPVIEGLRNLRNHRVDVIPGCQKCPQSPICDGGCRADVYNLTG